jgi:hypothetical protein
MKNIAVVLVLTFAAFDWPALVAQSPPDTRAAFLELIERPRTDLAAAVRPMSTRRPMPATNSC